MDPTDSERQTILLTVQHPGHVHFFRRAYRDLRAAGHDVSFVARDKGVVEDLFEAYDLEYTMLAGSASSVPALLTTQLSYEANLFRRARDLAPDVIAGVGGIAAAHVGRLLDCRSVVFTDTEHATLSNVLSFPFADVICTPDCFGDDLGAKHLSYPGYHELAYLQPDRFSPDPSVPESVGLDPDAQFAVLRFSDWNAAHDVGAGGFDDLEDAVDRIERTGTEVRIVTDATLPPAIASKRAAIEPHEFHDLLAHATLLVSEGATTAVESAVLGTPAVYVNSLSAGTVAELESRYGLLYGYHGPDRHRRGLERAVRILESHESERWQRRREALLADKCDPTEVVVGLLTRSQPARSTAVVR